MPRRFLIDGYNLLHAVGLPARLAQGQLRHCRDRLLTLIRSRYPRDSATVIFDAQAAPRNVPREQTIDGIRAIFADGVADDHIAAMLAAEATPRTLHVVSSDRAVQESARRRGAIVVSAEAFLDGLDPPAAAAAPSAPEKPSVEADADRWLDAFGSIDASEEIRNLQRIDPMNPDPGRVKKHRGRPKREEDR